MAILVDKNTRLLVQGITGREGLYHSERMLAYGTAIVAGVTPGKGGTKVLDSVPVYHTVQHAVAECKANASVIFVPPRFAAEAMIEAADAGIKLIVCITEGIPVWDVIRVRSYLDDRGVILVGPNCPGLLTPQEAKVGIIPGDVTFAGSIGVVSRSGTLTYEVLYALKQAGLGVSTCVGIGGDPIHGLGFVEVVAQFQSDPKTEAIVLIGEIGGRDEEVAAAYIRQYVTKPVVGFIAGLTAPPGKRMGHAGAIIEGGAGTAQEKIEALRAAGIHVAQQPDEIPLLLKKHAKL